MLTLLTQCLSSVGVLKPSPLNTCPKWPPQFEHTISVRCIPKVLSVCLVTAPGMLSK
nr:methioninesulfoxide reductase [Botrytis cinerea]WVD56318.1 methioninesulfoxide reductase [Botrytis cinerea]